MLDNNVELFGFHDFFILDQYLKQKRSLTRNLLSQQQQRIWKTRFQNSQELFMLWINLWREFSFWKIFKVIKKGINRLNMRKNFHYVTLFDLTNDNVFLPNLHIRMETIIYNEFLNKVFQGQVSQIFEFSTCFQLICLL